MTAIRLTTGPDHSELLDYRDACDRYLREFLYRATVAQPVVVGLSRIKTIQSNPAKSDCEKIEKLTALLTEYRSTIEAYRLASETHRHLINE